MTGAVPDGVVEILDIVVIHRIRLFRFLPVPVDVRVLHDPEQPGADVGSLLVLVQNRKAFRYVVLSKSSASAALLSSGGRNCTEGPCAEVPPAQIPSVFRPISMGGSHGRLPRYENALGVSRQRAKGASPVGSHAPAGDIRSISARVYEASTARSAAHSRPSAAPPQRRVTPSRSPTSRSTSLPSAAHPGVRSRRRPEHPPAVCTCSPRSSRS